MWHVHPPALTPDPSLRDRHFTIVPVLPKVIVVEVAARHCKHHRNDDSDDAQTRPQENTYNTTVDSFGTKRPPGTSSPRPPTPQQQHVNDSLSE